MELKLNMYVRTEHGIYKINGYINNNYTQKFTYIDNLGVSNFLDKNQVIKASRNIIDLIEVGDYVNGKKVGYIDDCDGAMREYYYDYEDINVDVGHFFEEIKSIVTKELFENIKYEVE